jgi:hypothetical protein
LIAETPAPPRLPLWVRAADAAALVSVLLGVLVLTVGGFTLELGARLRVHSPARLFVIAASIVALRHVLAPRDPLHRRLRRRLTDPRADAAAPFTAAALASRLAILVIGFFATVTIGFPGKPPEQIADSALNLAMRYDAGWYAGIALHGYSFEPRFSGQQNIAFFPAYPALMRLAGYPLGALSPSIWRDLALARLSWAGTLVSLAAFVWGALYLWRLARDLIGEERAPYAVALLAAYPFSVFYSAAYTESVFLLGTVAAFYHFSRGQFGRAAIWGLFVGLTRPNGCFLSLALAVSAGIDLLRRRSAPGKSETWEFLKISVAVATPLIGLLAYSAYVHHVTGSWFEWANVQHAWGRSYEGFEPAARAYSWVSEEGMLRVVHNAPFDTLNALGLLFAIAMLWPVARKAGVAYAVFVLVNLVLPFVSGGVLSMGRVTSTLFPIFIALAATVPRRGVMPTLTAFAMVQGLAASLFFTWRPLF